MELQRLIEGAFHDGPAHLANQLIHKVREQVQAEQGQALSYEVALMGRPFGWLQQEVAPRLALYLHHKRAPARAVFLSLFVGERLYFVRSELFFDVIRDSLGLDAEGFAAVLRRWQQTGTATGGLLPG